MGDVRQSSDEQKGTDGRQKDAPIRLGRRTLSERLPLTSKQEQDFLSQIQAERRDIVGLIQNFDEEQYALFEDSGSKLSKGQKEEIIRYRSHHDQKVKNFLDNPKLAYIDTIEGNLKSAINAIERIRTETSESSAE